MSLPYNQNNSQAAVSSAYRDALQIVLEKSDDHYEKNITFISSGTLVLSMTFIEKIVIVKTADAINTLVLSWVFLALTLLINLVSHQISRYYLSLQISELDRLGHVPTGSVTRRNKRMALINISTTITLIVGIFFLIWFCSANTFKMTNDEKKALIERKMSSDLIIKGLFIPPPPPAIVQNPPQSSVADSAATSSGSDTSSSNSGS